MRSLTYTSGGTISGTTGQHCRITAFSGSGTGATARLTLTGSNAIAASTAGIVTALGTGYTGDMSTATLSDGVVGTGTVTTNGTAVTWVSGNNFLSSWAGATITINSVEYTISSVSSPTALVLGGSAGVQASPVAFLALSARCSGSATVAAVKYYYPIQTTLTVVNSTTATLGTTATSTLAAANATIATDDSVAVQAAIQGAYDAGGGTVYFPRGRYLLLSQIAMPNDGINTPIPRQPPIKLTGDGACWNAWIIHQPNAIYTEAATVLDMRYTGAGVAKLDTRGAGALTIEDLSFEDHGYDTEPFLQTTNTAILMQGVSFVGSGPGGYVSANDAIVLGGTTADQGPDGDDAFQGYGTVIERNYFARTGRALHARVWVNSIVFENNTVSNSAGGVVAIEFDGTTGFARSNVVSGNLIETFRYEYGMMFRGSVWNTGTGNATWDATAGLTIADVRLIGPDASGNSCLGCQFTAGSVYETYSAAAPLQYFSGSGGRMGFDAVGIGMVPSATNMLSIFKASNPYVSIADNNAFLQFWAGAAGPYISAGGGPLRLFGTSVLGVQLDANATAGETRLLLWDVTAGALKRVSVGEAGSGGTGYMVLRVPN